MEERLARCLNASTVILPSEPVDVPLGRGEGVVDIDGPVLLSNTGDIARPSGDLGRTWRNDRNWKDEASSSTALDLPLPFELDVDDIPESPRCVQLQRLEARFFETTRSEPALAANVESGAEMCGGGRNVLLGMERREAADELLVKSVGGSKCEYGRGLAGDDSGADSGAEEGRREENDDDELDQATNDSPVRRCYLLQRYWF